MELFFRHEISSQIRNGWLALCHNCLRLFCFWDMQSPLCNPKRHRHYYCDSLFGSGIQKSLYLLGVGFSVFPRTTVMEGQGDSLAGNNLCWQLDSGKVVSWLCDNSVRRSRANGFSWPYCREPRRSDTVSCHSSHVCSASQVRSVRAMINSQMGVSTPSVNQYRSHRIP